MVKVDSRLQHVYDEAMQIIKDNQKELLKYSDIKCLSKAMRKVIEVRVNSKATSRRGCMKPNGRDSAIVELSEYMLTLPEKEMLTTMVHELLHCFKDSHGHEGEWKWRANRLKEITGLNITRVRSIENEYEYRKEYEEQKLAERRERARKSYYKPKAKSNKQVVCRCQKCGIEITRTRETRFTLHPQRYTHRNCGGHFERIGTRVEL